MHSCIGLVEIKNHFMRKLFLVVAPLLAAVFSFAQNGGKVEGRTSFFAEGGGPGILFSTNIDQRFNQSNLGIGARVGIGFVTAWTDNYDPVTGYYYNGKQSSVITVPVQFNYIFGKPNTPHSFEVGAGATYVGKKLDIMDFYQERRTNLFGTFSFMYRRQPKNGGVSWRIGFTPLFAKGYIQPFGGVSIGYNF
jgi:hypothetical protein